MEVCATCVHQLSSITLSPSLLGQNVNEEFIISTLIFPVILLNVANHRNPLQSPTSIPLGTTNTSQIAFPLALHQTLALVGMFGITISTNEERDAEG